MSKELEALRQLFEFSKSSASLSRSQSYEDLKILNEALKRKEKLEKVWEIVSQKTGIGIYDEEIEIYCYKADMTETEFNLLKEMMKW